MSASTVVGFISLLVLVGTIIGIKLVSDKKWKIMAACALPFELVFFFWKILDLFDNHGKSAKENTIITIASVILLVATLFAVKTIKQWSWRALLICAILLELIFILRTPFVVYATARSEIVEIHNTVNKQLPNRTGDTYMVYTDQGVFINDDCPLRFKWNSSDFQNELNHLVGKKVRVHYYWYRWPYKSWYPNIYKYELIGEKNDTVNFQVPLDEIPADMKITGRIIEYWENNGQHEQKEAVFVEKKLAEIKEMVKEKNNYRIVVDHIN